MGHLGAELGHLVHFINVLAGKVVEAVEVLLVGGDGEAVARGLHGDDRLEDGAFALLNPLAHAVEVGAEIDAGREDALALLTLALAVELFPPLADVVELRLEVDENLNLLASGVKGVTGGSILGSDVVGIGDGGGSSLLHLDGTGHEGTDVVAGNGDGQQANGGEDAEPSAHVVGDDVGLVALLRGKGAGGTADSVGDADDDAAGCFHAALLFALLLQQTEGKGGLGGGTRLADIDDAEALVAEQGGELEEVVLGDVVSGIDDGGAGGLLKGLEVAVQRLDDGTGTKVAAADAADDHHVALVAECAGRGFDVGKGVVADAAGQMEPADEIVAGTGTLFKGTKGGFHLRLQRLDSFTGDKVKDFGVGKGNHFRKSLYRYSVISYYRPILIALNR